MNKIERITKDCIELEEMDWQQAKTTAEEMMRQNKLSLDVNEQILKHCNCRLDQLFALLPEEEQKRRNDLEKK